MKLKLKKLFCGLLACCLAFGFQSACGTVLCIGADGQVSVEMTCGALVFPQQYDSTSSPLRSDVLSDQDGDFHSDKCAMDIPLPGVFDGMRIAPSDPSPLMPVCQPAVLLPHVLGHDGCNVANYCASLFIVDHALTLLRTTVLLI
ncbi:MAG: hypothetical protein Q7J98_01055 [Kiritimatiellia bacterium]|nr:hypothetical protein [Kiritimatiellia bacterium]